MPRLKFRTLSCSPAGTRHPGSVHDVSAEEAGPLVDGGYAFLCDAKGNAIGTPPPPPKTTEPPKVSDGKGGKSAETAALKPDGTRK